MALAPWAFADGVVPRGGALPLLVSDCTLSRRRPSDDRPPTRAKAGSPAQSVAMAGEPPLNSLPRPLTAPEVSHSYQATNRPPTLAGLEDSARSWIEGGLWPVVHTGKCVPTVNHCAGQLPSLAFHDGKRHLVAQLWPVPRGTPPEDGPTDSHSHAAGPTGPRASRILVD